VRTVAQGCGWCKFCVRGDERATAANALLLILGGVVYNTGKRTERSVTVKLSPRMRMLLLVVDALALIGVVAFSVLAALERSQSAYVIGQIVCALLILVSTLLLHRHERTAP
jgi:hypothetical protein